MVDWFTWSNAALKGLGIPQEKIVTTIGRNVEKFAPFCGIYSPHGIGRPDQIREYFGFPASRTIWSSDGYWGGTGECDIKGRCGVGEKIAEEIGRRVIDNKGMGFELLLRGVYRWNNDRANIDIFESEVIKHLK